MGAWSDHPMGCDEALDNQYEFLSIFNIDEDTTYLERDEKEIKEGLEKLRVADLKKAKQRCHTYVIPFTYLEYGVRPKDPKIRKALKSCLRDGPECGYFDDGEKIVKFFYKHFDDVMDGKIDVPMDAGLIATMIEKMAAGETGLVNIIEADKNS